MTSDMALTPLCSPCSAALENLEQIGGDRDHGDGATFLRLLLLLFPAHRTSHGYGDGDAADATVGPNLGTCDAAGLAR